MRVYEAYRLGDGLSSFGRSSVSKVSRPGQERVLVLQMLGRYMWAAQQIVTRFVFWQKCRELGSVISHVHLLTCFLTSVIPNPFNILVDLLTLSSPTWPTWSCMPPSAIALRVNLVISRARAPMAELG